MQEMKTIQGMDPKNLPRQVDEAVLAVDNFNAFLKKNDTLKPFVCDIEPNEFARCSCFLKSLGKSLCNPIQEPQQTSNIEWLLKVKRDLVLELIEEIKPLPIICDQGNPIICEKNQVFFTTDRPLNVDCEYSGIPGSSGRLHYGEMEVSIQRDHRRGGNLKEPDSTDPPNYLEPFVRICGDNPFREDSEAFFRALNVYINEKARCPDVLIFIHGFNSRLKKNVRR